MPKIEMLQDFQGVETNNVFYTEGRVLTIGEDIPDNIASRLLTDGRAQRVKEADLVVKIDEVEREAWIGDSADGQTKVWVETDLPPAEPAAASADTPIMTTTTQSTRNRHGKK